MTCLCLAILIQVVAAAGWQRQEAADRSSSTTAATECYQQQAQLSTTNAIRNANAELHSGIDLPMFQKRLTRCAFAVCVLLWRFTFETATDVERGSCE